MTASAGERADDPMIALRDVRFDYGAGEFGLQVPVLDVAPGERVACIGPSGTGKTTLVQLVAGILVPAAGSVSVGGQVVSAMGDDARRALRIASIGMVFQSFELLEYLSAAQNVLLPYHVSALPLDDAARTRARALMDELGIAHTAGRRPDGLSQGERQRVAIARALVTEPPLVMCDEPTGNLDPHTTGATLDLLFDQVARRGATLFMVTHDHGLLDRFDRVVDILDVAERSA